MRLKLAAMGKAIRRELALNRCALCFQPQNSIYFMLCMVGALLFGVCLGVQLHARVGQ